jgi:MraZ protein
VAEQGMKFRGCIHRILDAKGRLVLPPEIRDTIRQFSPDGRCMLTTYDDCLVAWPWPDWEEFENKLTRLRTPSRQVRDFRRTVLGGAEELLIDAQNRVRLSRAHMEYAGLGKEALIVGQVKRFEIWDAARFRRIQGQNFENVDAELAAADIDLSF